LLLLTTSHASALIAQRDQQSWLHRRASTNGVQGTNAPAGRASQKAMPPIGAQEASPQLEPPTVCFPIACKAICSSDAVVKPGSNASHSPVAAGDLHLACLTSCERLGAYCCSFCVSGSFDPDLETPAGATTRKACLETCPEAALGALMSAPVGTSALASKPKQSVTGKPAQQPLSSEPLVVPRSENVTTECNTWCGPSETASQSDGVNAIGTIASCHASCMEMFLQCDTSCMVAFSIIESGPGSRSDCLDRCRDEVHKQVPAM